MVRIQSHENCSPGAKILWLMQNTVTLIRESVFHLYILFFIISVSLLFWGIGIPWIRVYILYYFHHCNLQKCSSPKCKSLKVCCDVKAHKWDIRCEKNNSIIPLSSLVTCVVGMTHNAEKYPSFSSAIFIYTKLRSIHSKHSGRRPSTDPTVEWGKGLSWDCHHSDGVAKNGTNAPEWRKLAAK